MDCRKSFPKPRVFLWLLLIYAPGTLYALSYDSGPIELQQPDETTFISRCWGNEFKWEHETADGYTIIYHSEDGYWYYATLDQNGDYTPSTYKVGIDQPVGIPKGLRRTDPILSEINAMIAAFEQECAEQNLEYKTYSAPIEDNLQLGVIFVEFTDVGPDHQPCLHNTDPEYTVVEYLLHFNAALGTYNTENDDEMHSPDGEDVYGSMYDYWYQISRGNVGLFTTIINEIDNGVPVWIQYTEHLNFSGAQYTVWKKVVEYCAWEGMIPTAIQYICVVGAGRNWYEGIDPNNEQPAWHILGPVGGLGGPGWYYNDHGLNIIGGFTSFEKWDYWGVWYDNVGEKWFPVSQYPDEPHHYNFTNIGMYCHEAGHGIFGWEHSIKTHTWCLMHSGTTCGPGYACSCPTPPGASYILNHQWVTAQEINSNQIDMQITYSPLPGAPSITAPDIYMLVGTQSNNPNQDYFIFHNVRYIDEGFYKFAPGNPLQYSPPNPENNLLIWHQPYNPLNDPPASRFYMHLQCANDDDGVDPEPGDALPEGIPFPGSTGRDHLYPTYEDETRHDSRSCPSSYNQRWDGIYQDGIAFEGITSTPAASYIEADVYKNYWEGTLDDAPGGYTPYPLTTEIFWTANDIYVAGDVTVPTDFTLYIEQGAEVAFEPGTRIISEGTTVIRSDITKPFYIEGTIQIEEDVTIAEDATFTIYPGSAVSFAQDKKLIVHGRLIANGLNEQGIITFQRLNQDEQWEGLEIDHNGFIPPGATEIKWCNISGAFKGITAISTSSLIIDNCTIENNEVGIYGTTPAPGNLCPEIIQNILRNNSMYGIAMYGMGLNGEILKNTIDGNALGNVILADSDPHHYGDNIHSGCTDGFGLYCSTNSSPWLYYRTGYEENGYNNFTGNYCGVRTVGTAKPALGIYIPGFSDGLNNFLTHTSYLLDNQGSQTIWAERVYWNGACPPTENEIRQIQYVDYDYWLSGQAVRPGGELVSGSGIKNRQVQPQIDDLSDLLIEADQLLYSDNPTEAIQLYSAALSANPTVAEGIWAVWGLNEANQMLGNPVAFLSELEEISAQFAGNAIGVYAEYLSMVHLSSLDPINALAVASSVTAQTVAPEWAMYALLHQAFLEKYGLGNIAVGVNLFEQFIEEYPEEELANLARIEIGLPSGTIGSEKVGQIISAKPETYIFHPNHPNPFNASTAFRFYLPYTSIVTLEVYNLMGQKVASLEDGILESGEHQYVWDTSKGGHSNLASGLYFCKIKAKSRETNDRYETVRKLLLLK